MPFTCTICEEESTRICVQCTKDTCSNHLCEKCGRCSDCCDCDIPLDDVLYAETMHPEPVYHRVAGPAPAVEPIAEPEGEPFGGPLPDPDPRPEPPHPPPDPDPIPEDE